MIEIYLLEQLCAFKKYGTLSRASEELHISQPALTRSMKKLEDTLGVPLFNRQKNKLSLNDTGELAAQLAAQLVEQDESLERQIHAFDRSKHTIVLGSCAVVPSMEIGLRLRQLYAGMTITSEVVSDEKLYSGFDSGQYQLIVTHELPPEEKADLYNCVKCGHERLFVAVPPAHPLAAFPEVSFADLDEIPFLQFANVGFWYDMTVKMIPHPHLLLQNDREVFTEIADSSALPTFASDYFMKSGETSGNYNKKRVVIPLSDPEAETDYFLICKKEDKKKYSQIFNHLPDWCVDGSNPLIRSF